MQWYLALPINVLLFSLFCYYDKHVAFAARGKHAKIPDLEDVPTNSGLNNTDERADRAGFNVPHDNNPEQRPTSNQVKTDENAAEYVGMLQTEAATGNDTMNDAALDEASRNNVPQNNETAKRDGETDAVIARLDSLAQGTADEEFGTCKVKAIKADDKSSTVYVPTSECEAQATLGGLFKGLPEKKKQKIIMSGMSRNIIQTNKFSLNPKSQFSTDKSKQSLTVTNIVGKEPIKPIPWLTLENVVIDSSEIVYKDLADENSNDWVQVSFEGSATTSIGGESVNVRIEKKPSSSKSNKQESGDSDVVLLIDVPSKNVDLQKFMKWLDTDIDILKPSDAGTVGDGMKLESITVQGNGPNMIKVILLNNEMWNAFMFGKPTGSPLFKDAVPFYVYCKNGEIEDFKQPVGAIMAKFKKGVFPWAAITGGFDLRSVAGEVAVLDEISKTEERYFQSSRDGFSVPDSEEVADEFAKYSIIDDGNGNVISETYSAPEACLRYRMENFAAKFPQLESMKPITTTFIDVCPSNNKVSVSFPKRYPNGIFKYAKLQSLAMKNGNVDPGFDIDGRKYVHLSAMEVKAGNGVGFEWCLLFNFEPNYQMLPAKEGTVELKNTTVSQCFNTETKKWTLSGSGEESILSALTKVTVFKKNEYRTGITGASNIFNIAVVRDRAEATYLNDDYAKAFPSLLNFPLKDLRYESFFQKRKQLFLKGTAVINELRGINAEIVYYYNRITKKFDLAACLAAKNFEMSRLLRYIYKKHSMGKGLWKMYSKVAIVMRKERGSTVFDRSICKNAEKNYDKQFRGQESRAFKGGILVVADTLDLRNCEVDGKPHIVCTFYHKLFGDELDIVYYGQATPDKFFAEGKTLKTVNLGTGIKLQGLTINRIAKELVKDDQGEEELNELDEFIGTLKFADDTPLKVPAKITITGHSALFTVPRITKTTDDFSENYLDIANVKAEVIESESHPLSLDKEIEYIEFHSPLLIGSVSNKLIKMKGGIELTAQHVYGTNDPKRNRFFSCRGATEKLKFRKVFAAFGVNFNQEIFKKAVVWKACFTYHPGISGDTWSIEDKGIEAKKGLRLYGTLETSFGKGYMLEMLFEDNAIKTTISMLPPLRWSVTVSEKERKLPNGETIKVKASRSRMKALLDEDDETIGPKYYIEYQNGQYKEGYLEGFIRTVGHAGPGKINFDTNDAGKLTKYKFEYEGKLFGRIQGKLELNAEYDGEDFGGIDFDLKVEVSEEARNKIHEVTTAAVKELVEPHEKELEQLENEITTHQEDFKKVSEHKVAIMKASNEAKKNVKRSKIERARYIQAASKRCVNECKPVPMPGLAWKENCMRTRKGQHARCMKYTKNKDYVSNVGCLAKCESERVRSHVGAVAEDGVARTNIGKLETITGCGDIASKVDNAITSRMNKFNEAKNEITAASSFAEDLKKGAENKNKPLINIRSLISNYKLIEATEPNCLKFNLQYEISTGNEETSKDEEITDNICFDGQLLRSIADLVLDKSFNTQLADVKDKFDSAAEMRARYLSKYKEEVTDPIKELDKCMKNLRRGQGSGKQGRSYIPNGDLSPLRSSAFHVYSDETVLMFEQYSPWAMLKSNDPFTSPKKLIERSNIPEDKPADPCTVTRRTIQDYQDIIDYMRTWARSHKDGEETLGTVKSYAAKRVLDTKNTIDKMASAKFLHPMDVDNMKHWINATDTGLKKWMIDSTTQLQRLNKEGVQLMKNELSNMYTTDEYRSIDDYFKKSAKTGGIAFKKANIAKEGEMDEPFSHLSKELLHLLKENSNLDSILPVIEQIRGKIQKADKRSISCTLK